MITDHYASIYTVSVQYSYTVHNRDGKNPNFGPARPVVYISGPARPGPARNKIFYFRPVSARENFLSSF